MTRMNGTPDGEEKNRRDPTVALDRGLYDRLRAAVLLVRAREQPRYTVTQAAAEAVESLIRRVEIEYNNGQPVQPDPEPLRPGVVSANSARRHP
ncbi:hypothetical protein ACFORH_39020 [Amycolatopsis roodepoortensis]|uniref:Centromere-binding protein ParB C-terminal domain-containing protein n=1 Tax=Amycolatopsis roodepoortensis TaxID=700274 RepID=A0ABR9LIW0_9PSEU|nr:hypothetical protein [Amycolatopsis roodepoortensis]MBE1580507.1 hypothetical protein [Amycolatopsis roodepoortensis]